MCCHFLIYSEYLLNEPENIEDGIGDPNWRLIIGLGVFWITIFLVVLRGVQSSGKAAYFLALFPYVIMITLLIRGATLDGAGIGIEWFFEPQWEELANPSVREWMIVYLMVLKSVERRSKIIMCKMQTFERTRP
jgi:solute carrier family 6 amino acid transporter-like protein 5/7/9/14